MVKLKGIKDWGKLEVHIDREILDSIRKDGTVKRNLTHSHAQTKAEVHKLIPLITNHIEQSEVEKASNWMLFKDLWLQNESNHLQTTTRYRNYTRGTVVMSFDWGTGNIGTEIRYPHPGVVLYDQEEDWVIVAPITAASIDKKTGQPKAVAPFDVLARKQIKKPSDKKEYWFQKHSVIQVDQIQRLSKYRILNKKGYKLRANLLNQIDNIILEYYLPGKFSHVKTLEAALTQKSKELAAAQAEIKRLEGIISSKKTK